MNKLTLVVPVYNVEEYLETSINSLKNQSFKDFKCVLVNDGSTDNSLELINKLIKDDNRFTVVTKENGGLSDARNYGFKYVDSEYVYFFDSDDLLVNNCLEKCVEYLDKSKADMAIFDYYQVHQNTGLKEVISNKYEDGQVVSLKEDKKLLINISNCAWNKMYKTSLFKDNNIEYPKGHIYEDLGTTYPLLLKSNKVVFIKEPLYEYVVDRSGNITGDVNIKRLRDILFECDRTVKFFKDNNEFDNYYEELKYLCGINIIETLRKCIHSEFNEEARDFIMESFEFLRDNFKDYPKCKYNLKVRKDDWVYLNEDILMIYLKVRGIVKWKR